MSRPVKCGGGEYEDSAVDEQGEHERHGRVYRGELDGLAFACGVLLELARLDNGRVQVKIVRHDGRANDADGDVEHVLIFEDLRTGDETQKQGRDVRFGKEQFRRETTGDGRNERDDQRFNVTKPLGLQEQDRDHVQRP